MELHNSTLELSIVETLNDEQANVFRECIHGSSSVFCTGRGGTGKSTVTESVIRYFRNAQFETTHQIAVTASTGVAAFLIKGITLHRFAGVGILENDKTEMIRRASKGKSKEYWEYTDTMIIDEVSMISAQFFDNLSHIGKYIKDSNEPFGGIRILMFGDFLQLPPVSRTSSRVPRVFESDVWKELCPKTFILDTVVRQQNQVFNEMVSKVRVGECTTDVCHYFESLSRDVVYEDDIEPVRLYSLRATTDEYNESKLNLIGGQTYTYKSVDKGDTTLLSQCPVPKTLQLKVGCQVMFNRNCSKQVVNGSIGTIIGFRYSSEVKSYQPLVKLIGRDGNSFNYVTLPMTWDVVEPNGNIVSSRIQIPLILAWAVTIHKSQGQTIPRLYVDLRRVFEKGQAYVALSRCTDPSSIQVVGFRKEVVMVDKECLGYYDTHSQQTATSVAKDTLTPWDKLTADTAFMLGHLSVQETSSTSQQDLQK